MQTSHETRMIQSLPPILRSIPLLLLLLLLTLLTPYTETFEFQIQRRLQHSTRNTHSIRLNTASDPDPSPSPSPSPTPTPKPNPDAIDILDNILNWLGTMSLRSVADQAEVLRMIEEIRADEKAMDGINKNLKQNWASAAKLLRDEDKSVGEYLGAENTARLLRSVEDLNVYDPSAIRAFVETPVFENMLGGILYEGIFEFLQKVDILGNIVNKLPIIGPIRVTIVKEFKKSLDRTVGGQIKAFLSSFNKVAVNRMVEFILSPNNRQAFSSSIRSLTAALLARPISQLVSLDEASSENLQRNLWESFKSTPIEDIEPSCSFVYDKVGDRLFKEYFVMDDGGDGAKGGDGGDGDGSLEIATKLLPATTKKVIKSNVKRFLSSPAGKKFLEQIAGMAEDTEG